MDADIMCQGTLQLLLNIQFKDDEIAAVVPERIAIGGKKADALGVPS